MTSGAFVVASRSLPKISVIVAVLNGKDHLQRCIDSYVRQTHPNKELIILDGGSSDGTVDIIRQNESSIAFWRSCQDRGIADAWNAGLARATGDWVIFHGSDDRFSSVDAIESIVPFLDPTLDLVYGKLVFEGGPFSGVEIGAEWDERHFRRRMTTPHPASFLNKNLFRELGEFDETFTIALDYEFLLRKSELRARFVNRTVSIMEANGVSMTSRTKSLMEARRAQIKNRSNPTPIIYLWHCYFRANLLWR
jgi:glycosyltransferase involved in cell wall biosynthesis